MGRRLVYNDNILHCLWRLANVLWFVAVYHLSGGLTLRTLLTTTKLTFGGPPWPAPTAFGETGEAASETSSRMVGARLLSSSVWRMVEVWLPAAMCSPPRPLEQT